MKPELLLYVMLITLCNNQETVSNRIKDLKMCDKSMWRIIKLDHLHPGQAKLRIKLEKVHGGIGSYDAVLACSGLVVQGTGSQFIKLIGRKTIEFPILLPQPLFVDDQKEMDDHTCTFELRKRIIKPSHHIQPFFCNIIIKSALSRIVPHCKDIETTGEDLVEYVRILKEQGKVHIHFKESFHQVIKLTPYCNKPKNVHNELQDEELLYGLGSVGAANRIYVVEFYPDCDAFNASFRKLFMKKQTPDCYVHVYAVCQEGYTMIKSFSVELKKDSIFCLQSKTKWVTAIDKLKLIFKVDSAIISILLFWLLVIIVLYFLLIPCCVIFCCRSSKDICSETRRKLYNVMIMLRIILLKLGSCISCILCCNKGEKGMEYTDDDEEEDIYRSKMQSKYSYLYKHPAYYDSSGDYKHYSESDYLYSRSPSPGSYYESSHKMPVGDRSPVSINYSITQSPQSFPPSCDSRRESPRQRTSSSHRSAQEVPIPTEEDSDPELLTLSSQESMEYDETPGSNINDVEDRNTVPTSHTHGAKSQEDEKSQVPSIASHSYSSNEKASTDSTITAHSSVKKTDGVSITTHSHQSKKSRQEENADSEASPSIKSSEKRQQPEEEIIVGNQNQSPEDSSVMPSDHVSSHNGTVEVEPQEDNSEDIMPVDHESDNKLDSSHDDDDERDPHGFGKDNRNDPKSKMEDDNELDSSLQVDDEEEDYDPKLAEKMIDDDDYYKQDSHGFGKDYVSDLKSKLDDFDPKLAIDKNELFSESSSGQRTPFRSDVYGVSRGSPMQGNIPSYVLKNAEIVAISLAPVSDSESTEPEDVDEFTKMVEKTSPAKQSKKPFLMKGFFKSMGGRFARQPTPKPSDVKYEVSETTLSKSNLSKYGMKKNK